MTKKPKKNGRPTKRTPEVIKRIVEGLTAGVPLAALCREDGMPGVSTVYDWMDRDEELSGAIGRARNMGWDAIAVDAMRIIDENPDRILTEQGDKIDPAHVSWAKNRAELRLKLLAKWDPKRYGDLQKLEHSGDGGGPLSIVIRDLSKPDGDKG